MVDARALLREIRENNEPHNAKRAKALRQAIRKILRVIGEGTKTNPWSADVSAIEDICCAALEADDE